MRNITKTDENTVVWLKSTRCRSAVQKVKIIRVWEDADSYEFKYDRSEYVGRPTYKFMHDEDGFSPDTYRDIISGHKITETIARYDKPLNFWREIKVMLIRGIHLLMERMEFNLKN